MPKIPRSKRYKKYSISKNRFRELYYFSLQYHEWQEQLEKKQSEMIRGMIMDDMPKAKPCGDSDKTSQIAMDILRIKEKMNLIESAVWQTDETLYRYLLDAVTNEGVTYESMRTRRGIPCSANTFYERKRKYYWILSQLLEQKRQQ